MGERLPFRTEVCWQIEAQIFDPEQRNPITQIRLFLDVADDEYWPKSCRFSLMRILVPWWKLRIQRSPGCGIYLNSGAKSGTRSTLLSLQGSSLEISGSAMSVGV
jgi:hypothetical protein